jgi:glycine dehydrogenase subunit 2
MKLIFEKSKENLTCLHSSKELDKKNINSIPENLLRKTQPNLPSISEVELIRHYIKLSKRSFGVDDNFYPLGSCTMKYNPKINEQTASLEGFTNIHPLAPESFSQGALQILYETEKMLCAITGMDNFSLQPYAGAHGEITGIMIMKAYHNAMGNTNKTKIIIPDSAHGTNPSSAGLCGYKITTIKSNKQGCIDLDELEKALDNDTAGLMLTNPNTLGLFEKDILKISEMVHKAGGLLYYDGANLNAIMGKCKPGDMGFDIMHVNLHKTFATPHGGGGPGSGPVGVKKSLEKFLPNPRINKIPAQAEVPTSYSLSTSPASIGNVSSFFGNFLVIVKAYTYIRLLGKDGLKNASEIAVLNANYMAKKLKDYYTLPHDKTCMHEFVLSGEKQAKLGVHTKNIAKRLIDYNFHPPTVYFPLIVDEAIMIEPTETESIESLDNFIDAMIKIAKEAETDKEKILSAPLSTPVKKLDETLAARQPILRYKHSSKYNNPI